MMKKIFIYTSLLLLLTCAKEDSETPGTPPSQIIRQYTLTANASDGDQLVVEEHLQVEHR